MENKEDIIKDLKSIVEAFNGFYRRWMRESECHANFVWIYDKEKGKQLEVEVIQGMEVATIDKPIYRRTAASDESVVEALRAARVAKNP